MIKFIAFGILWLVLVAFGTYFGAALGYRWSSGEWPPTWGKHG